MNIIKTLFKDSFIYGISSYVNLLAAFILIPIHTIILSKESYGLMDLCITWNNFFMLIIPLGLTAAMLRTYQDYKTSPEKKKIRFIVIGFVNFQYCVEVLTFTDIRLMPIENDKVGLRKCGFKILQYMSLVIVTIADDIGENKNIDLNKDLVWLVRNNH